MQDLVTYCGDTVRVCGRPFRRSGAVPQPASTRATARRSIDLRAPGHGRVHNGRTYTSRNLSTRTAPANGPPRNLRRRDWQRRRQAARPDPGAFADIDAVEVGRRRARRYAGIRFSPACLDTGEITTEGTPPSVTLAVTVAPSNYHGASSVAPPETGGGSRGIRVSKIRVRVGR